MRYRLHKERALEWLQKALLLLKNKWNLKNKKRIWMSFAKFSLTSIMKLYRTVSSSKFMINFLHSILTVQFWSWLCLRPPSLVRVRLHVADGRRNYDPLWLFVGWRLRCRALQLRLAPRWFQFDRKFKGTPPKRHSHIKRNCERWNHSKAYYFQGSTSQWGWNGRLNDQEK